jgi:SAM-dependent methyltransferase
MDSEKIKKTVRERYGRIASQEIPCCSSSFSCCNIPANSCGCNNLQETISKKVGYTDKELQTVPEGANLGLGCGNPVALASLKSGETVLDLGSGAGFDCFLAANVVGKTGKVIGVDMTPDMIAKARENAVKGDYQNVEFRQGEIENLPVADNSVDTVISNCVINLVPDKRSAFREICRVLKPGGKFIVSDIVLNRELPPAIKNSIEAYVGCIAGASLKSDYLGAINEAGFQQVEVIHETVFPMDYVIADPIAQDIMNKLKLTPEGIAELESTVISAIVTGYK